MASNGVRMIRGVGLRSATAINVASMVGAGPFITLPLVVTALHGSISAIAWIAGAVIALCDGLVWAELASRYPRAGGSYAYLRSAFGGGFGRLAAFLFVWQFLFWAPLVLASGYIGFAQYAAYLVPALAAFGPTHLVAVAVGIVTLAALYRAIPQIARTALVLGTIALVTLLAVSFAGLTHPHAPLGPALAATFDPRVGIAALGGALVITLYDYAGYGDVCALGEEVIDAPRVLPRSIVLAVLAVGTAYVLLNAGAVAALSPREIAASTSVASLLAERAYGPPFAVAVTLAVLVTAFGSTYALLLAAARVPYAAARDGDFLPAFAALHQRARFPHVGLVTIGLLALPASLLPLDAVIAALTAGIVLVQNVGQIVALAVVRARERGPGTRTREAPAPFRIPLYPLPPLVALAGWLFLFSQTGARAILFGLLTLAAGAVIFLTRAAIARTWPFTSATTLTILALAALITGASAPAAAQTPVLHRMQIAVIASSSKRTVTLSSSKGDHVVALSLSKRPRAVVHVPLGAPALRQAQRDVVVVRQAHHDTGIVVRQAHHDGVTWGHAALGTWDGEPALLVDGRPFFFWGGAFFYERLPASRWRQAMLDMRELGANTLDLYVPWNWHELRDGEFDFDGHTNPRRNLREVLRLARELGFRLIVRPGPVIRNEWRNGGYPAWLLERPEYGMPLHDVLEGRYPATATLQNAHGDDAAAQWMRNATHLRYASRWLHRAMREFAPVADRVIAVQLDDDQGAYLDNQTYPAAHLHAYLHWLDAQVRDVIGPITPTFINTYQMRVPSSSPVWTMGNWYQSEAYAIGAHDRSELDLSTAMLRTNRRGPLAQSEFQAGWLASPEDPLPRAAAPQNTTLALYDLLSWGVKGVIDFPMQDTLAPFGWEAPFSNALYAWDAAYAYPWAPNPGADDARADEYLQTDRWPSTAAFGKDVARYGQLLAETHRMARTAIVYPDRAARAGGPAWRSAFARLRSVLEGCARTSAACDVVTPDAAVKAAAFDEIVVIDPSDSVSGRDRRHLRRPLRFVSAPGATSQPGTLLTGRDASFLIVQNWVDHPIRLGARPVVLRGRTFALPLTVLDPRSARLIPLDLRLRRLDRRFDAAARLTTSCLFFIDRWGLTLRSAAASTGDCEAMGAIAGHSISLSLSGNATRTIGFAGSRVEPQYPYCCTDHVTQIPPGGPALNPRQPVALRNLRPSPSDGSAAAYEADVFEDGERDVVLDNGELRVVVVPSGGGRVPVIEPLLPELPLLDRQLTFVRDNLTDATGALRDDVLVQPPLSTTDRIGPWTRTYPAGTFNRPYVTTIEQRGARRARIRLVYHAPDTEPAGGTFERVLTLEPGVPRLVVDERYVADPAPSALNQRLVSRSSLAVAPFAPRPPWAAARPARKRAEDGTPFALDPRAGITRSDPLLRGRVLVTAVTWRASDVEDARLEPHVSNATLRLQLAPGWRRFTFSVHVAASAEDARKDVEAERAWLEANPGPAER